MNILGNFQTQLDFNTLPDSAPFQNIILLSGRRPYPLHIFHLHKWLNRLRTHLVICLPGGCEEKILSYLQRWAQEGGHTGMVQLL
jgi:hypothetical protein